MPLVLRLRLLLFGAAFLVLSPPAEAHVKWFAAYDVPSQPLLLSKVFDSAFIRLAVASLVTFFAVCLLERTALGGALGRGIDRMGAGIRARSEDLYRAGTGAFFVALFTLGNVILTPELHTNVPLVPWLQVAIAIGVFWRPTMILSAAGIGALYAYGVLTYGIYHLLDYPIFLGLALYLAMASMGARIHGFRPIDVARWAAAVTLMWASIEKWAYPQWTYPLLDANPDLCMGFSSTFYMQAAGFVEFSLAFALLWTPLVRTFAATVLSAMFLSAILPFGRIDAIGHLMIIIILVTVGADNAPVLRKAVLAPVSYCVALAVTFAAYYGIHAAIYGTRIW